MIICVAKKLHQSWKDLKFFIDTAEYHLNFEGHVHQKVNLLYRTFQIKNGLRTGRRQRCLEHRVVAHFDLHRVLARRILRRSLHSLRPLHSLYWWTKGNEWSSGSTRVQSPYYSSMFSKIGIHRFSARRSQLHLLLCQKHDGRETTRRRLLGGNDSVRALKKLNVQNLVMGINNLKYT